MEVLVNQKILVIQTAFLGDAVLTLPMIQQLMLRNKNSQITILCIPSTEGLFRYSGSINKIIVYDKRKKDKSVFRFINLIKEVRKEKFDLAISPHRSLRSTLISFFSKAKKTVGFNSASMHLLYRQVVTYDSSIHEVARNLSLINFNNAQDNWKIKPEVIIPEPVYKKIENLVCGINAKKNIAIAPGSVWKTKVYPKNYFEELIQHLVENDFHVLFIGGKDDAELCDEIAAKFPNHSTTFAGRLSIIESIALIKKCDAMICNDSAPTHLAMIADIPTLTIYCSTIPQFGFYPYNSKSKYISYDKLSCKPCGIHGHNQCPIKTFECAYKLLPSEVFKKLQEIIPV